MASDLFELEGFEELKRMVDNLGQVPRKVVRASARAGGRVDVLAARSHAPVGYGYIAKKGAYGNTGALKKAITQTEEKSSNNGGKAVMDIRINPNNYQQFKRPYYGFRSYGGTPNGSGDYFYPASMEYGFITAKGYWEGYHYLRNSADINSDKVKNAMIDKALKTIDNVLESR